MAMSTERKSHALDCPYTYTQGFRLTCWRDVSTTDILNVLDEFRAKADKSNKADWHIEGGGGFCAFGHENPGYKSARFALTDKNGKGTWPWIEENKDATEQEWRKMREEGVCKIIWKRINPKRPMQCWVTLKAFQSAPVWTPDEVRSLYSAFERALDCAWARRVADKKLVSYGDLGKPRVHEEAKDRRKRAREAASDENGGTSNSAGADSSSQARSNKKARVVPETRGVVEEEQGSS